MLQRIRVAALAFVLAVSGAIALVTPAASAAPAPTVTRVGLSPAAPVVVFDADVAVTFTFTTTNAATAGLKLNGETVAVTSSPVDGGLNWTGTKSFGPGAAGKWDYAATARGDGGEVTQSGSFDVVKALTTKIVDFDAGPDLVDRGETIRVSGRLLADGRGYDGQSVSLTFRERGSDDHREVVKVTTGRDGRFDARVEARATGWWRASFAATATARASVSDSDRVDVRRRDLGSTIAGFDASPEPVDQGDRLSFTGALRVEGRGGLAGERVSIFFKADGARRWEYVTSDVTGRHGRFHASAEAVASGWWRAEFRGSRGISGSTGVADWVRVDQPPPPPPADKADTRLIKFNAYPEPVKRGGYLRFRGVLQIDDEGSWVGYQGRARLYFKPLGSKKWQYVKSTWSTGSGRLYTKAKAWTSGRWKFTFRGDDDAYGSGSRSDLVRVKR